MTLPLIASAAGLNAAEPGIFTCTEDPCTLKDLIGIISQAFDWAIKIVVPLATLAFLYAGILFVTSPADSGNVSQAKKIIWDALYGVGVALAAWLIVKAIIAGLGGNPADYGLK